MTIRRILVPTDGSETAREAGRFAAELAKCEAAEVVVLGVVHPRQWGDTTAYADMTRLRADVERTVSEQVAEIAEAGVKAAGRTTETEQVHAAIRQTAEETGADLILMGAHGRAGLERAMLGSVADRVVQGSRVPVMLVPMAWVRARAGERAKSAARS